MDGTGTRPPGRYGDRPPAAAARRRRLGAAGVVALGLLGVGYAGWYGLSAEDVRFAPRSYEHLEDGRLRVTFEVTRPPGTAAVCEVEALSSGAAQVGLTRVAVPASDEPTVLVSAVVRTSERAVTGQPVSCEPA